MPTVTQDDIEALRALAESCLYYPDVRISFSSGEVTLAGIVRGPAETAPDIPAATARLELLASAEQLIAALEPAGWQLADRISLTFSTEVHTFATDAPSRQLFTSLTVDLRMLRASLAADAASVTA